MPDQVRHDEFETFCENQQSLAMFILVADNKSKKHMGTEKEFFALSAQDPTSILQGDQVDETQAAKIESLDCVESRGGF